MIGALFRAGLFLMVGLALVNPINTFLVDITNDVISALPGITTFELAWFHLLPIVLVILLVIVWPLTELVGRKWFGGGEKDEDED